MDDGIGGSGYDLEALSDYLDRGRQPAIPAIDDNVECEAVLDSLERFGSLSRDLVVRDARQAPALDEGWFGTLMTSIAREVKAGRDIPYPNADPRTELTITEGAIREIIRAAGDSVPGVLVGTCRIGGEVAEPGGVVDVALTISVLFDRPLPAVTGEVRAAVHSALLSSTPLTVGDIDITVDDVHLPTRNEEPS